MFYNKPVVRLKRYEKNTHTHMDKLHAKVGGQEDRDGELTYDINCSFTIGKPSGGSLGKINPIRQVISSSQRCDPVVIPIVHQRVSKNEVTRNLGVSLNPTTPTQNHHHSTHHAPLLKLTCHFKKQNPKKLRRSALKREKRGKR